MKNNKLNSFLILTLITLLSCSKDDPDIDYSRLIIGEWTETRAIDSFIDYVNPAQSKQTEITNISYKLVFNDNSEFSLSQSTKKLDSGDYYFSEIGKNDLNFLSRDNLRAPKILTQPTVYFSTYQVIEITEVKLILKLKVVSFADIKGNLLSSREFIWELSRQ